MEISQKLGICHVRRPVVSRDRRILVKKKEVCKPNHVVYLLLIF